MLIIPLLRKLLNNKKDFHPSSNEARSTDLPSWEEALDAIIVAEIPEKLTSVEGLGSKQELFPCLILKLLAWAYRHGYRLRCGELLRMPEQQEVYNRRTGNVGFRSLHQDKLAIDLNLFQDRIFLTRTQDHLLMGLFWESLHPLTRWGGRFFDGNHYSLEHEGRK